MLLFPVDMPQFEKWIPVAKSLPQFFEILFRVTNDHGSINVGPRPLALDSNKNLQLVVYKLSGYLDSAGTSPDSRAVLIREIKFIARLHVERLVPGIDVSNDAVDSILLRRVGVRD